MISISNLYFSYTGKAPYVLSNLNLVVADGEYLSIIGDNGSGKSTLIKLCLHFLKPSKGALTLTNQRIGYVAQRPENANSGFPLTVFEVLDSYRRLLKLNDKTLVSRALERIGMRDFSNALIGNLSGGQTQKIMISRALLGDPDLLILDEPSTGIDQQSQRDIYQMIKAINQQHKTTILAIEHNLPAASANSTAIFHLSSGQGQRYTIEQYRAMQKQSGYAR